jgi:hypothetical protein
MAGFMPAISLREALRPERGHRHKAGDDNFPPHPEEALRKQRVSKDEAAAHAAGIHVRRVLQLGHHHGRRLNWRDD